MNIRLYQFLLFLLTLICACSDSGSSGDNGEQSGGASEAGNSIAIEDKTIAGVSEKGPFINGSAVTIYELDFENLGQTGRTYTGKIASDHGDFRFTHVNLVSQYALLEVNGFYRNEITGKESVAPITLNAMVDFSDRRTANINLLTHLAYARMQYLVDDGVSVLEAKKQAEKEILKAFYIQGDVEEFEDLSIFEAGDGNAALLAISILMQGDLNEAKFSSRLANFAYDIEKDGVWEDSVTATQIADWAFGADYNQIETNIKSWNLGSKIPDFRPFVKHYWWYNFGLGDCSSKNDGEEKQVSNKLSTHTGEMFVCKNSDWTRPWYSREGKFVVKDGVYEVTFTTSYGGDETNESANIFHTFIEKPLDLTSDCTMLRYSYKGCFHDFQVIGPLSTAYNNCKVDVGYFSSSKEWKEVFVHWSHFNLSGDCGNTSSTIDMLKKITEIEWNTEQVNDMMPELLCDSAVGLQVKDFECMTEAELYKYENLENNCKVGDIKTGNKSKYSYLCKDGAWKFLDKSLDGSPCVEENEEKIFQNHYGDNGSFLCRDGSLQLCNESRHTQTTGLSVNDMVCDWAWRHLECTEENKCEELHHETGLFCNGEEWEAVYDPDHFGSEHSANYKKLCSP